MSPRIEETRTRIDNVKNARVVLQRYWGLDQIRGKQNTLCNRKGNDVVRVRHLVKALLVESEKGPKKCLWFERVFLPFH